MIRFPCDVKRLTRAVLFYMYWNCDLGDSGDAQAIKPQTQDVVAAMGKFEAEIAAHDFGDTNRTLNRTPGAMPDSVN